MSNGEFCPILSCFRTTGRSGARLYADAANVLADNVFLPELIELFKASNMIEIGRICLDSLGWTRHKASSALSARPLYRLIGLQREIRQHRHQAEPGPEPGIDQQVVASNPA